MFSKDYYLNKLCAFWCDNCDASEKIVLTPCACVLRKCCFC